MIGPGFAAAAFAQSARVVGLVILLALVAAFGAGFAFDRWLHRPISVAGSTVHLVRVDTRCYSDGSIPCATPAPIPPWMINCEPTSEAGDGPDTDDTYAAPGRSDFKLRPWVGICPFPPFINQACQQET